LARTKSNPTFLRFCSVLFINPNYTYSGFRSYEAQSWIIKLLWCGPLTR